MQVNDRSSYIISDTKVKPKSLQSVIVNEGERPDGVYGRVSRV